MDPADIAWILAAAAFVTIMFPGLAFLYGGMLNGRGVLNMLMMVMTSLGVTVVVYVLFVHGLVVGDSIGGLGLIGNPFEYVGFLDLTQDDGAGSTLFGAFFILFAAISVALVASGAAGRMKFGAWLIFAALWVVLVYGPLGHWVFAISDPDTGYVGGWMRNVLGLHDFAGGTAVHMNAGAAGLALALVLGRRSAANEGRPHNLPMTLLGAGLLMVGWLGFNGGTAGGANFTAQYVVLTSIIAAGTGMLGFLIVEKLRDGHFTMLGTATGAIAGLVGITPSADAVDPIGAVFVGLISSAAAAWAITWKRRHRIDDSMDVFAVHGIAGIAGALFVVFFGNPAAPAELAGIAFGGDPMLLVRESIAIIVTLAYSFGMTFAIAWVMNTVHPIRISDDDESNGIDRTVHAESAYERSIA